MDPFSTFLSNIQEEGPEVQEVENYLSNMSSAQLEEVNEAVKSASTGVVAKTSNAERVHTGKLPYGLTQAEADIFNKVAQADYVARFMARKQAAAPGVFESDANQNQALLESRPLRAISTGILGAAGGATLGAALGKTPGAVIGGLAGAGLGGYVGDSLARGEVAARMRRSGAKMDGPAGIAEHVGGFGQTVRSSRPIQAGLSGLIGGIGGAAIASDIRPRNRAAMIAGGLGGAGLGAALGYLGAQGQEAALNRRSAQDQGKMAAAIYKAASAL